MAHLLLRPPRYAEGMPVEMTREEFEIVVNAALDEIPDDLAAAVRNVVVLVEDDAPPEDPMLLGLYDGLGFESGADFHGPARIFVYRNNLQEMCEDRADLEQEIRITVLHEVAHHFGLDERRLHELGYG